MPLALNLASGPNEDRTDKRPGAFRTITEVAEELATPQHVLRFWETRFPQIKPLKRAGGRRYYRPDDVDLIKGVQHLLHRQGYTIKGAQRVLKEKGVRFVQAVGRGEAEAGAPEPENEAVPGETLSPGGRVALEGALAELRGCRALLQRLEAGDSEEP
ncbi:MerR family transcriptional regulator [Methylobacterium organophilum]|uniref:MerR family transcriptional regulator n=1 Tax=Methylobacterium organophilum TaxID=410 RepID=UPI001F1403A7|nr:MerR family transcriptional regulator [Methylobacterium organophilum]UMY19054.1 MerR family transcriptional regulator [Methylobacterium organophilum]